MRSESVSWIRSGYVSVDTRNEEIGNLRDISGS